jgi:hypothetical protein
VAEEKQNDCGCGCLTQPKKGSKSSKPKKKIREICGARKMAHLYDCVKWESRSSLPSNEPLLTFPPKNHRLAQTPYTQPNAPPVDQPLNLLGTDLLEAQISYFNPHFCV